MKASHIAVLLLPQFAAPAGLARLAKDDDAEVTTREQAEAYRGPVFNEDTGTEDLHVVYRDGFVCVNFLNEWGERVNYDYPMHTVARVHRK
ncbi:hypothetical protein [Aeromonas phage HJG]|uniref:Uncharacterized protein n=1 Tax=Aeromonas phage MJG TaxID=2510451 RepID=A0A5J6A250_9CAUD|nr:hypothetical protein [Aeromonas phage MJG]QBJ01069.1 hypothetical protein [Aeromonas phage HJG]